MKNFKLQRGTSFIEFYYRGLFLTTSKEVALYIKANKWYFDRASEEVKEQFRRIYKIYKRNEVEDGEKD